MHFTSDGNAFETQLQADEHEKKKLAENYRQQCEHLEARVEELAKQGIPRSEAYSIAVREAWKAHRLSQKVI